MQIQTVDSSYIGVLGTHYGGGINIAHITITQYNEEDNQVQWSTKLGIGMAEQLARKILSEIEAIK